MEIIVFEDGWRGGDFIFFVIPEMILKRYLGCSFLEDLIKLTKFFEKSDKVEGRMIELLIGFFFWHNLRLIRVFHKNNYQTPGHRRRCHNLDAA